MAWPILPTESVDKFVDEPCELCAKSHRTWAGRKSIGKIQIFTLNKINKLKSMADALGKMMHSIAQECSMLPNVNYFCALSYKKPGQTA